MPFSRPGPGARTGCAGFQTRLSRTGRFSRCASGALWQRIVRPLLVQASRRNIASSFPWSLIQHGIIAVPHRCEQPRPCANHSRYANFTCLGRTGLNCPELAETSGQHVGKIGYFNTSSLYGALIDLSATRRPVWCDDHTAPLDRVYRRCTGCIQDVHGLYAAASRCAHGPCSPPRPALCCAAADTGGGFP